MVISQDAKIRRTTRRSIAAKPRARGLVARVDGLDPREPPLDDLVALLRRDGASRGAADQDQPRDERDGRREHERQGQRQAQLLQAQPEMADFVEDGQGQHEGHEPEAQGDGPHRHLDGVAALQDPLLDAAIDQEGHRPADDRGDDPTCGDHAHLPPHDAGGAGLDHGKAHHGADDGMGCGDGLAEERRDIEPEGGRQQGRQHPHDELHAKGVPEPLLGGPGTGRANGGLAAPWSSGGRCRRRDGPAQLLDIHDPFADGLRHAAPDNQRAEELEDARQDHRLSQRQRARAHRRAHRVRHVVRTDVPGHVQPDNDRHNQDHGQCQAALPCQGEVIAG